MIKNNPTSLTPKFKKGDMVRCIKPKGDLVENKVYKIVHSYVSDYDQRGYVEVETEGETYFDSRFELDKNAVVKEIIKDL